MQTIGLIIAGIIVPVGLALIVGTLKMLADSARAWMIARKPPVVNGLHDLKPGKTYRFNLCGTCRIDQWIKGRWRLGKAFEGTGIVKIDDKAMGTRIVSIVKRRRNHAER